MKNIPSKGFSETWADRVAREALKKTQDAFPSLFANWLSTNVDAKQRLADVLQTVVLNSTDRSMSAYDVQLKQILIQLEAAAHLAESMLRPRVRDRKMRLTILYFRKMKDQTSTIWALLILLLLGSAWMAGAAWGLQHQG